MNISDWQHEQNRSEKVRLETLGFEFDIDSYGYSVRFRGQWIAGTSSFQNSKTKHYKHRLANLRDHLQSAISVAYRSQHYKDIDNPS